MQQSSEMPYLIDIYKIPEKGKELIIKANAEQCVAIAKRLKIPAVLSLTASAKITKDSSIRVQCHFEADLKQNCVITLETIQTHVQGKFEEFFTPSSGSCKKNDIIELDMENEDPLPLEGHELDVGELILEHLSLSMNPYPKKEGLPEDFFFKDENFDSPKQESPFAKLADLKLKKSST